MPTTKTAPKPKTPRKKAPWAKNAGITAIYGARGSGKTTQARAQIAGNNRLIVASPIDEWGDLDRAADWREATAKIAAGFDKGFRVFCPLPAGPDAAEHLHFLSDVLWRGQRWYFEGRDRREITLLVDELNMAYPHSLPRDRQAFTRLILQGRHAGVNIIGITQRPAKVHPDFRDNAFSSYIFRLHGDSSFRYVQEIIGREHMPAVRGLGDHEFVKFEGGRFSKGRNSGRF